MGGKLRRLVAPGPVSRSLAQLRGTCCCGLFNNRASPPPRLDCFSGRGQRRSFIPSVSWPASFPASCPKPTGSDQILVEGQPVPAAASSRQARELASFTPAEPWRRCSFSVKKSRAYGPAIRDLISGLTLLACRWVKLCVMKRAKLPTRIAVKWKKDSRHRRLTERRVLSREEKNELHSRGDPVTRVSRTEDTRP